MSMIRIHGAKQNNLKNISVDIPKHQITVFTGRSGSGKSSLVLNTIAAESERLLNETYSTYIQHQLAQFSKPKVDLIEHLPVAMIINQKRLGGNSRSTVGTISDIYASVRLLWSELANRLLVTQISFHLIILKVCVKLVQGLVTLRTLIYMNY